MRWLRRLDSGPLERLAIAKENAMTAKTQPTSSPHDDAVVEMLSTDPDFANEYLAAVLYGGR